jgi:hypothetical protein
MDEVKQAKILTHRDPLPKTSIGATMRLLAVAERAAARGKENIDRQRALIQELRKRGDDTTDAETLLATLDQNQVKQDMDCIRLRMELALALRDEVVSSQED